MYLLQSKYLLQRIHWHMSFVSCQDKMLTWLLPEIILPYYLMLDWQKARVVIPKLANHEKVGAAIIKQFPKLKEGGGYEILRYSGGGGAGQKELSLIHPGPFGYTAPYLKDRLGQAIAYVRPLQKDLSEDKLVFQVNAISIVFA